MSFFFFFSQDLLVWAGATSVMGASMVHIPLFNRLHEGKVPWLLLKSQHKQNDLTEKAFFFFFFFFSCPGSPQYLSSFPGYDPNRV